MSKQSKRRLWSPGMAILGVCLLFAFHSGASASGELLEAPAATPAEFRLQDLSGRTRGLGDFVGSVVLINFWASWCRPCIEEMPAIRQLTDALKDSPFVVVAINVGESPRRVQTSAKRLQIDFPVLLDRDNAVFHSWGATVLPAARVIDCHGKIRYRVDGPVEWDRADIITTLQTLAAEGCRRQPKRQTPARN